MKICRFTTNDQTVRLGLLNDDATVTDLTSTGLTALQPLLESGDALAQLRERVRPSLPRLPLSIVTIRPPVERQEIWAAGVTYLRSKTERMAESNFSATAYDRVYEAERPEIFFKALAEKVAATREEAGIRRDAKWNVPEPELALVFNSAGKMVGCTIGNDMSSRDIEGENLLYLPQAKTYRRSCALGPCITLGATEAEARQWTISLEIKREGKTVFSDKTSVSQIKRRFDELADFLFRSQEFPHGVVLLTGTGIVPPAPFTLQAGDWVGINISGIGVLENTVAIV